MRLLAALAFVPALAGAQLVTSSASFVSPQVVDISAQTGGYNFGAGPTALPGGVTFTASASNAVLGDGSYGLVGNGTWGSLPYAGTNGTTSSFRFTFDGPLSAVGGFMNYAPGYGTVFIRALGVGGATLAEYDVTALAPISTPNGFNAGAFRGIERVEGDIYAFEVQGAYAVARDITYADVSAVPEPATLGLVGGGIVVLFGAMRRRRTA